MGRLPNMVYGDSIYKRTNINFGGYDHRDACDSGSLYDMKNLTAERMPFISTRKKRYVHKSAMPSCYGIFLTGGSVFCVTEDTDGNVVLKRNNERLATSEKDSESQAVGMMKTAKVKRHFAQMNNKIMIIPDNIQIIISTAADGKEKYEVKRLDVSVRFATAKISDGTYGGIEAKNNTLSVNWTAGTGQTDNTGQELPNLQNMKGDFFKNGTYSFNNVLKEGDALTIWYKGKTLNLIVREVESSALRFYENSFSGNTEDTGQIEIWRDIPNLSYICEHKNRIWGCYKNTIYASKLGDMENFNVFDGISTDSYTLTVDRPEPFTAVCSHLGYPCFFRENEVFRVLGTKPQNFEVSKYRTHGVANGSGDSIATVGGVLFYHSPRGIAAFSGGEAQLMSLPFGEEHYINAVGGSDGVRYFVSMKNTATDESALFCYDTRFKAWHKEDDAEVVCFFYSDGTLTFPVVTDDGARLMAYAAPYNISEEYSEEGSFDSFAEFGDFTEGSQNKKRVNKLSMRVSVSGDKQLKDKPLKIEIMYDSDGNWHEVKEIPPTNKKTVAIPIIPRRCDHFRLRVSGGEFIIYSLSRDFYDTGIE